MITSDLIPARYGRQRRLSVLNNLTSCVSREGGRALSAFAMAASLLGFNVMLAECCGPCPNERGGTLLAGDEVPGHEVPSWWPTGKNAAAHLWHWGPAAEGATCLEFVNGVAGAEARLPCVRCDKCELVFFGNLSTVPYVCPDNLRAILPTRPISLADFTTLVSKIRSDPKFARIKCDLLPGTAFASVEWSTPTKPVYEIFWPDDETIVNSRVSEALRLRRFTGVAVFPATIRHAGTTDARIRPIPQAALGDVDGMYRSLPAMAKPDRDRLAFYSLNVPTVSGDVDWAAGTDRCPECTYSAPGQATEVCLDRITRYTERHRSNRTIPRHATANNDFFRSRLFPGLIVTDEVHQTLVGLDLENARFQRLRVVDEPPEAAIRENEEGGEKDGHP